LNEPAGFDLALDNTRSGYIINDCFGTDPCEDTSNDFCVEAGGNSNAARLARLEDGVATLTSYAEDQARRSTFDTTDEAVLAAQLAEADGDNICPDGDCTQHAQVCKQLEGCFESTLTRFEALDESGEVNAADVVDDQFLYTLCFNETLEDLQTLATGTCSDEDPEEGSASGCSPYSIDNGAGFCGAGDNPTEPVCPERISGYFASFDPAYPDLGANFQYAVATAAIRPLYLCPIGDTTYDTTDRTSADFVGLTLVVNSVLKGVVIIAEVLKDSLPHWEVYIFKIFPYMIAAGVQFLVEKAYDLAGYHDGLVDGAEVEAIYENTLQLLDGSAAIYDEVVCRCVEQKDLRGQGCDSIDNDCDDSVDECDEDNFPPEIDISDASLNCASGNGQVTWFTSNDDALECVSTYSTVVDDCDTTAAFGDGFPSLSGTCDEALITVEASDRCGNPAEPKTVPVFVDLLAPVVSCGLGESSNPTLYVQDTGAGIMTDVKLEYEATDNCGRPLDVKVEVFANEIEDFHNQETAIFFRNGMPNNAVGMYVAAQYCVTDANGQCVKDPVLDTRVYTVVVSTSDEAGNVATPAECQVVILPQGTTAADFPIADTKQRFLLSSYSSNFTEYFYAEDIILS
ncbi:MAG: hypothetical protein SGILL_006319, partial [Bacillariaceae sp.]